MAEEQKPGGALRFYRNLMRFSAIGLLGTIILVACLLASLVNRLEMMMPAEVQLIFQLMRNRFFR